MVRPELPTIGLFSGAGGLDLGAQEAGGQLRLAVEPDVDCGKTLLSNDRFFPKAQLLQEPLETVPGPRLLELAGLKRGEVALVVGGPPCQPFSKSGYWLNERRLGLRDPRANLIMEFLRVVRWVRPEAFVLENVASLRHPANRVLLDSFLRGARRSGYTLRTELLHAVEYGVPQTRARLFVVGLKGKTAPVPAAPTHWWRGARDDLLPPETAGKWISHLDRQDLHEPYEDTTKGTWGDALNEVPPGGNYKALTAWAGHPEPKFVAETKYWSFLLKLSPFRPSWTLQAQPGPWTGPFHWDSRRLRRAELAAIQSFPADYQFEGERRSAIKQIGNAVPPLLASKVIAPVLDQVAGHQVARRELLEYTLTEGFGFDEAFALTRGHRW